uniref:Uncharacterized protein n=1 Tax=Rhizophora mucronata TaxID=61149 RepID=A0A2P2K5I8_RHIMU
MLKFNLLRLGMSAKGGFPFTQMLLFPAGCKRTPSVSGNPMKMNAGRPFVLYHV